MRYIYVHCLKVSFQLINECGEESKKKSRPLGAPPCMYTTIVWTLFCTWLVRKFPTDFRDVFLKLTHTK